MDFVSNKKPQIEEMLKAIGITKIEELFESIPEQLRQPLILSDDGLSESEGLQLMQKLSEKNFFSGFDSYLGAGAYDHYVPAIVGAICSKSEFLTAYTPYQAEASQGMLQAIFEYQSAICALTGMDVSNASLYDGASACAEAILMALRLKKERTKILIAEGLHPNYRGTINLYTSFHQLIIETVPKQSDGTIDLAKLKEMVDDNTAALLIQSPNFLGIIEESQEIADIVHSAGALLILCANPLSYGIYASAADVQADIAVGDCQPLGLPLQFGGPYVGYMACREEFVRQMPGRLVGETIDNTGKPGFVLTLQAREQHIRREKATSNICTNQALAALASLVAILWYGPEGIKTLALRNYQMASYLKTKLEALPNIKTLSHAAIFNEFAIDFGKPVDEVIAHFRSKGIEPGIPLNRFYPDLKNHLLVTVTETKSKAHLDHYIQTASDLF